MAEVAIYKGKEYPIDENGNIKMDDGVLLNAAEGVKLGKLQMKNASAPSKPAGATALDVAKFGIAPLTSTYFDIVGDPLSKDYWEKKGLGKGIAGVAGGLVPAAGDVALNMSMFSGVGTAPASAAKAGLFSAAMARKAGGGLLADFASGAMANAPKALTRANQSLSQITGEKLTGEFLKNSLNAKELATINNYDAAINSVKTQIINLQKQVPNIKPGATGVNLTAEQSAKIEGINAQLAPLERQLKNLQTELKVYVDKVGESLGSKVESQVRHTPFLSGTSGMLGGAAQRGAYKHFGDEISEGLGLEGKNMYERTKNLLNNRSQETPQDKTKMTNEVFKIRPKDKLTAQVDSLPFFNRGK